MDIASPYLQLARRLAAAVRPEAALTPEERAAEIWAGIGERLQRKFDDFGEFAEKAAQAALEARDRGHSGAAPAEAGRAREGREQPSGPSDVG